MPDKFDLLGHGTPRDSEAFHWPIRGIAPALLRFLHLEGGYAGTIEELYELVASYVPPEDRGVYPFPDSVAGFAAVANGCRLLLDRNGWTWSPHSFWPGRRYTITRKDPVRKASGRRRGKRR
jgi:hypothetical protein